MTLIHSMEDLAQAKNRALDRQRLAAKKQPYHISVGMASCSIAVGARDTYEAINRLITGEKLTGVNTAEIHLSQTGCIGLCALEPIVQVDIPGQPPVTYGKVTPEVARRILKEHIGKGLIVQEYKVENV